MKLLAWMMVAGASVASSFALAPAHANDSAAELSIGGLVLTRSADISMESEDLAISLDAVRVRYRFLNLSQKPVALTVAFPLPDIDLSEADNYAIPVGNAVNFVGFETKIDGKPVDFTMNQRAVLGNKDVSAQLRNLGIPLMPFGNQRGKLGDLPQAARNKLIDEGLLVQAGQTEKGNPIYDAGWILKTSAVRQQTFAPGRPVAVEHRYHPSIGMGFDTILRKAPRQNRGIANEIARYRRDYCVSDRFLANLDKIAGTAEGNTAKVQERRINYVLKTGANWAGPIKQFKLTVDSGKPDRLVSFCAPSVKAVAPTLSEVSLTDFTPDKDLKILIVGKF